MKTAEYCKGAGGPLILWGTDPDRDSGIEKLTEQLDVLIPDRSYTIAAFSPGDWNADFSPWAADVEGRCGDLQRGSRGLYLVPQRIIDKNNVREKTLCQKLITTVKYRIF